MSTKHLQLILWCISFFLHQKYLIRIDWKRVSLHRTVVWQIICLKRHRYTIHHTPYIWLVKCPIANFNEHHMIWLVLQDTLLSFTFNNFTRFFYVHLSSYTVTHALACTGEDTYIKSNRNQTEEIYRIFHIKMFMLCYKKKCIALQTTIIWKKRYIPVNFNFFLLNHLMNSLNSMRLIVRL